MFRDLIALEVLIRISVVDVLLEVFKVETLLELSEFLDPLPSLKFLLKLRLFFGQPFAMKQGFFRNVSEHVD